MGDEREKNKVETVEELHKSLDKLLKENGLGK